MKCPGCGKDWEPCKMCRTSEVHQYCINDKMCHKCAMEKKWGKPSADDSQSTADCSTQKIPLQAIKVAAANMRQRAQGMPENKPLAELYDELMGWIAALDKEAYNEIGYMVSEYETKM